VDERTHQLQLENWTTYTPDGATSSANAGDAEKPFRKWLSIQPKEYQDKINNTQSASITSRAIDKFQAAEKVAAKPAEAPKPTAPQDTSRRTRIQEAVQPKSAGVAPAKPAPSEADHFNAGFASDSHPPAAS